MEIEAQPTCSRLPTASATLPLVTIPRSTRPFWLAFHAAVGGDAQSRFYEAFHFDDNEPSANELAKLVLVGTKRATAGLVWSFEARKQATSQARRLCCSVVTKELAREPRSVSSKPKP